MNINKPIGFIYIHILGYVLICYVLLNFFNSKLPYFAELKLYRFISLLSLQLSTVGAFSCCFFPVIFELIFPNLKIQYALPQMQS